MANICTTDYKVTGSPEQLKVFFDMLDGLNPNGSHAMLYELADKYKIDYSNRRINVRGEIIDLSDYSDAYIDFTVDSAWTPCTELFEELNEKLFNNELIINWVAVEPGCDIYQIHDPDGVFIECDCCTDISEKFFDGDGYIYEDVDTSINRWCQKMKKSRDQNDEDMIEYINEYDYSDEDVYYLIHVFENVE